MLVTTILLTITTASFDYLFMPSLYMHFLKISFVVETIFQLYIDQMYLQCVVMEKWVLLRLMVATCHSL